MHRHALAALLVLAGCAGEAPAPPDIRPVTIHRSTAPAPIPLDDVVARFDLAGLEGTPSGIAIEPDTGRRLLLLEHGAIVALDGGEVLWTGMPTQGGTAFSDIAALGGQRVAITSVSDGYLVDLPTGHIRPHFCYEPGWWEGNGEDPVQISQAVAFDATRRVLYAQPRTITQGGFGEVTESFVSAYDEETGADVAWWGVPDLSFVATGMAILETGPEITDARLLLAAGQTLHAFDGATGDLVPAGDLATAGVATVNGLAIDREARTLLALDLEGPEVVEIRLSALGL